MFFTESYIFSRIKKDNNGITKFITCAKLKMEHLKSLTLAGLKRKSRWFKITSWLLFQLLVGELNFLTLHGRASRMHHEITRPLREVKAKLLENRPESIIFSMFIYKDKITNLFDLFKVHDEINDRNCI